MRCEWSYAFSFIADATTTGYVSLHEINVRFDRLPAQLKPALSQTFAKHKHDGAWPPKRDRTSDYILATCEVLAGQDQWGMSTRETFLVQTGEGTHAKWAIEWQAIGKAVKRSLVEAVIRDKLGDTAIRCWRIMEAKGKLDEKHVRFAFPVFRACARGPLTCFYLAGRPSGVPFGQRRARSPRPPLGCRSHRAAGGPPLGRPRADAHNLPLVRRL